MDDTAPCTACQCRECRLHRAPPRYTWGLLFLLLALVIEGDIVRWFFFAGALVWFLLDMRAEFRIKRETSHV